LNCTKYDLLKSQLKISCASKS